MISACYLPDLRLTVVKLEERVPMDEVMHYVQQRYADDRFPAPGSADSFVDLRALTNTHSYTEVSGLSDELRRHAAEWGDKRVAILVGRDAHYGVGRMFGMVMSARTNANISIFRKIEDASEWLGHPLAAILAETPADAWIRFAEA